MKTEARDAVLLARLLRLGAAWTGKHEHWLEQIRFPGLERAGTRAAYDADREALTLVVFRRQPKWPSRLLKAPAAATTRGATSEKASTGIRNAGPDTLTAATTSPVASRTGAATAFSPVSYSSAVEAQPRSRTSSNSWRSAAGEVTVATV